MKTTELGAFVAPNRSEVTENNQAIFDHLQKAIGFVPNLYAYFAKNDTALADYLALQNRKSTLSAKEREVINLVTSEGNHCRYCQSAHTAVGKMVGFSEEQIKEIRKANVHFDSKIDALAKFTKEVVDKRGHVSAEIKALLMNAGYSESNLVDIVMVIGDKTISNYIHGITGLEIDWPLAEEMV